MKNLMFIVILLSIGLIGCSKDDSLDDSLAVSTLLLTQNTSNEVAEEDSPSPTIETHLFLESEDVGKFDEETSVLYIGDYAIPMYLGEEKSYAYTDDYAQIYYPSTDCSGQGYVIDHPYPTPIISNHEYHDVLPGQYPLYVVDYNWSVQRVEINSYMDAGVCRPVSWNFTFRMVFEAGVETVGIEIREYTSYEIKYVVVN